MPTDLFETYGSYVNEAIRVFREGRLEGNNQIEIRKRLKNEIVEFHLLDQRQTAQLERMIHICKSPCSFIINLYLRVNYPDFKSYAEHRKLFCRIYDMVREIAPEFIGREETEAYNILSRLG